MAHILDMERGHLAQVSVHCSFIKDLCNYGQVDEPLLILNGYLILVNFVPVWELAL